MGCGEADDGGAGSGVAPIAGLLVSVLVYSAAYSLVVGLAYDFLAADEASLVRFVTNLVTALVLLVLSLVLHPLGAASILRLVTPVTALGFVMYLLSPERLGIAALLVSGAGRKLFDILTWVIVARAVSARSMRSDAAFGLLIAGKDLGFLAGLALSAVVLRDAPGSTQVVTIVPVVLLILIICFSWLFPERQVDRLLGGVATDEAKERGGSGKDGDVGGRVREEQGERVAALARTHGLTRRETEVLALLARGRTQAVVADKLGISTGTAHTHIIHVYQKLGVNRQQNLIEMVESTPPEREETDAPSSEDGVNPPLR